MKGIIKAQIFQIKKERLLVIVFLLSLALGVITWVNEDFASFGEIVCDMSFIIPQISMLFLFAAIGVICGMDFSDKTANYEIMSGHTRLEVYLGRVILAVTVAVAGSLAICLLIIGIGSMVMDWGDAVSLKGVLIRVLLLAFPMFRIACEMVFVVFIVRNAYLLLAMGFFYTFALTELFMSVAKEPASYYLGMSNICRLMNMTAFQTYNPANPEMKIVIYDTTLQLSEIFTTIGVSLGVGFVFLLLGYRFFKTDDIG